MGCFSQDWKGKVLPQSNPVGEFQQEDIDGLIGSKQVVQVIPNVETAILIIGVSGLGPYQVGRGTGQKFPADDQVGQPLIHRKFGIGKAVINIQIHIFINLIGIVHQIDLLARISMIPVLEAISFGIGDHFKIRVFARGGKGLTPVLDGEVGSNVEVDPDRHAKHLLIDRTEDIARIPIHVALAYILQLVEVVRIGGKQRDGKGIHGPDGHEEGIRVSPVILLCPPVVMSKETC